MKFTTYDLVNYAREVAEEVNDYLKGEYLKMCKEIDYDNLTVEQEQEMERQLLVGEDLHQFDKGCSAYCDLLKQCKPYMTNESFKHLVYCLQELVDAEEVIKNILLKPLTGSK